ncbi:hypothetical protein ACBI99_08285 [Nonomuraea sp. ATR24]
MLIEFLSLELKHFECGQKISIEQCPDDDALPARSWEGVGG